METEVQAIIDGLKTKENTSGVEAVLRTVIIYKDQLLDAERRITDLLQGKKPEAKAPVPDAAPQKAEIPKNDEFADFEREVEKVHGEIAKKK